MPSDTALLRPMESREFPWYDSQWLSAYANARRILREARPSMLQEFERAMDKFRTPADFQVRLFERVFDDAVMAQLGEVTHTLQPTQLELHEARSFKRFVVHDHPLFNELQQQVVERVSEAAGEPVEACYNFLSLYGPQGVCPPHMDAPLAKWTLDLCIAQSQPWPIHFSPIVPWPEPGDFGDDWEEAIKRSFDGRARSVSLEPGQAVLFAGSSQWHYRDPMPGTAPRKFCDLLFFHFIPHGTRELVEPANWSRLFGVPELSDPSVAT